MGQKSQIVDYPAVKISCLVIINQTLQKGVRSMVMWKLKSCPRCGGDMFIERENKNWYQHCLQCSYRSELKNLEVKAEAERREASTVVGS